MSIRKSLAISFAEKYTVLVISIVSVMILARLLSPEEIGIFSVSIAVVGIAQMVRDFGVTQYLIVEQDLTKDRIRAAFGLTILISWSIAAALYFSSGAIAGFYKEPALVTALSILSINFLLIPFGNPVLSLLRRDMAFGTLFWINTATSVIREGTAVSLAFMGVGFMSLVWGSLASVATTAVLATICRPSQAWVMPGLREWRRVVAFGLPASATALVSQVGINASDLILGRLQGFAEVGIYSRALGLVNLFHQNIMSAIFWVSLPAFAASQREGGELKTNYLRAVGYVTAVAWPFYGFLALMAYPIVRLLFGDQWDLSVPLVQILALSGAFGALWTLSSQVLLAIDKVKNVLHAEIAVQSVRVVLTLIGAYHSLAMVAVAQVVTFAFGFVVYQNYLSRFVDISFKDIFLATYRSLLVALISLIGPAAVVLFVGLRPGNFYLPLVAAGAGLSAGWLAGLHIVKHPIRTEILLLLSRMPKP